MGAAGRSKPKALSWHCGCGAHSKHTTVCFVGVSSCCMHPLACSVARLAFVQALGAQGLAGSFF